MIADLSRMDFAEVFLISTSKVDESIYSDFRGTTLKITDRLLEAQARIAELELDVLVYLDIGMEPMSYFLGLARLARAQCVLPGHPVTTGISTIDYFLSSEVLSLRKRMNTTARNWFACQARSPALDDRTFP